MYVQTRRQFHYAVLRVKSRRKELQAEQSIAAALEGDARLLKEMKAIKEGNKNCDTNQADNVGGAVGEENIAEMFKDSYEKLFNSSPTVHDMTKLKNTLEDIIGSADKVEVNKVTGDVVREAVAKLKPRKTDVSGSFVSDALKEAPNVLYDELALVFQSWLYHGTVTRSLLHSFTEVIFERSM